MGTAGVIAVIALVVALVAVCLLMKTPKTGNNNADSDTPNTEEGRKIAVVRGTTWVTSSQITAWLDPHTTGG